MYILHPNIIYRQLAAWSVFWQTGMDERQKRCHPGIQINTQSVRGAGRRHTIPKKGANFGANSLSAISNDVVDEQD